MDEFIESLHNPAVFPALDANSEYWEVEFDETDCDKTAFTVHHGQYRLIWLPFRVRNAQSSLQHAMDASLTAAKWHFAIVCLDDVVVSSKPPENHISNDLTYSSFLATQALTSNSKIVASSRKLSISSDRSSAQDVRKLRCTQPTQYASSSYQQPNKT